MKIKYIPEKNYSKSWNTSSSSPKVFSEKIILKLLEFSGESQWCSVIFSNHQANGQWSFRFFLPPQVIFLFLCLLWSFERLCLKTSLRDCFLLEQYFSCRDSVIRPYGLLQFPSLLNDNSLLKTFFQGSIKWLYMVVISLYYNVVTFCMCSLYFVYGENNQTKQTKKITCKMYEHRIWSKLKTLPYCTLPWF